jgi:hypothetical protein
MTAITLLRQVMLNAYTRDALKRLHIYLYLIHAPG